MRSAVHTHMRRKGAREASGNGSGGGGGVASPHICGGGTHVRERKIRGVRCVSPLAAKERGGGLLLLIGGEGERGGV